MMDRRFLVGGVFASLVGILFFVNAPLAFRFPVNHALVTIAGATAGLLALVGVSSRMRTRRARKTPPDPGQSSTAPGADLEAALAVIRRDQHVETADEREQVYDRLAAVAIQLLQHVHGIDADEARRRLGSGEWTDDPEAAAFFETGPGDDAPFVARLTESFSDDARFARRARRVAAELDALEADR